MNWTQILPLPYGAHLKDELTSMVISRFPVDPSKVRLQGNSTMTRQLEWRDEPEIEAPPVWVDIETGNLVLIEAVGNSERLGVVQASLWIAATDLVVPIGDPTTAFYQTDFNNNDEGNEQSLSKVLSHKRAEIRGLDFLALP